uniref:Thioredoxin domain-containing protein n=1 Tax=Skeletonema marinoi TaxID=267567 RepID=A0A7S2LL67_9STRA
MQYIQRFTLLCLSTMTTTRPRKNLLLLSVVALALLSTTPLLTYAQDAATADIVEDDVTDLGDVIGDAMGDITEGLDEEVVDLDDAAAAASVEESSESEEAATVDDAAATADETTTTAESTAEATTDEQTQPQEAQEEATPPPAQTGPFIDLFGEVLLSLEMVDETHAQVHQHYTNEVLSGKKVVGLYFSADWCGPCRQFTPDLVNFYDKMNARRGKKDEFEIIWVSRCRDVDSFGQYFTHMKWLALPPQEAMGQRGQYLGEKFKVKSIPTLVLLDEIGNVITLDGRNKIPMDKAGVGFPWRSPMSVLVSTLFPRSFRLLVKSQIAGVLEKAKAVLGGAARGGAAAR